VLLPSVPGPRLAADGNPLNDDLRVDGPAAAWVRALLAGNEVLDGGEAGRTGGRALRRANGAVFLAGTTAGGPLERRAELEGLARPGDLGAQQGAGREQRVRWQVDAAQVEARLGAARERAGRAAAEAEEARRQSTALADEMSALEHETATLAAQRTQWEDQLK